MSHPNNLRAGGNYHRERVNKLKLKLGVDLIAAEVCLRGERMQDVGLPNQMEKNGTIAESWKAEIRVNLH